MEKHLLHIFLAIAIALVSLQCSKDTSRSQKGADLARVNKHSISAKLYKQSLEDLAQYKGTRHFTVDQKKTNTQ